MYQLFLPIILFLASTANAWAEGNNFIEMQRSAKCYGGIEKLPDSELEKLKQQGISEKDWKHNGVNCFTGDFNGDTITDYVLIPSFELPVKNQTNYSHSKVAVIFMPVPGKEPAVTLISKKLYNAPVLYSHNHSKHEKEILDSYGCPTNNTTDGIMEGGEGGTSYIFLWDKKKSDFVTYTCASENA